MGERDNTFLTSMVVDPMDAAIRQQVGTADSNAKEMKRKTARESRAAAKAEMRAQIVEAKTGIGASNESSD